MTLRTPQSRLGFAGWLLLAAIALWGLISWPLPRIFRTAIPHTSFNTELQTVRPITAGDHLQLLYHFWLGLDTLSGHSPPFHNIYEFNLGDDDARIQPDLYYIPFSWVYAAIAPVAGHAAGWNAAGLASVLLGVWFIGLLARRFSASPLAVLLTTLVVASLPYRWITLFTGSPTGFAMAFPPLLIYGLDRAIRDRSPWGGLVAGLALFFSYTSDLHTFYFSALAVPFFTLLSLGASAPAPFRGPGEIRRVLIPLLPFVFLAVAAIGISILMNRHLAGSVMASGRSLSEMASYSPSARSLIATGHTGTANHAYFGIPLLALLAALLIFWSRPLFRRGSTTGAPPLTERMAVLALTGAIAIVILLALGIHGPVEGILVRLARKVVPKYTMIRQTVKIYCLLPALLTPLLALLFGDLFRRGRRPFVRSVSIFLISLLALWTVLQALAQTSPGFCRLPDRNDAYAAVATDDAANAGRPPHALALPLWPGNSHWTSLCEYAAMLSRVRLVNGYAPAVPAGYFEHVFKKYESLNQGVATDEQLDGLLALGVRHLILHANAFPEQVSPFPAASTLRSLVSHPRLAPLVDDGLTFAFRILPKHPVEHTPYANWTDTLHAAARYWSWDPPLEIPHAQSAPLLLRAPVFPAPGLRYLLRPAPGSAQPLLVPPGSHGMSSLTHPIAGLPDWLQADLPNPMGALVSAPSDPVSLDYALLAAGDLPAPDPDGTIRIPPALLFHLGLSTPGQNSVILDPEKVPARQVLYGPNLPFPPGIYDVTLSYFLPAGSSRDSPPGIFRVLALPGHAVLAESPLPPDSSAITFRAITFEANPIRFEFHYTAQTPLVLRNIRLVPSTLRLVPVP